MTTLEEQLDELLAMAANAGRLGEVCCAAEKTRETALDRRKAGRRARETRALYTSAERTLSKARARFLAAHASAAARNEK